MFIATAGLLELHVESKTNVLKMSLPQSASVLTWTDFRGQLVGGRFVIGTAEWPHLIPDSWNEPYVFAAITQASGK